MSPPAALDTPELGWVFAVRDAYTGSGGDKESERFQIVVEWRQVGAQLMPRSASVKAELEVPMQAHDRFDKTGWVSADLRRVKSIPYADLRDMERLGPLKEPWRAQVIEFYRQAMRDRRAARGR